MTPGRRSTTGLSWDFSKRAVHYFNSFFIDKTATIWLILIDWFDCSVMISETGFGNFSFSVPMAHQEATEACGGVMGRSVDIRPVHGMPSRNGSSSSNEMPSSRKSEDMEDEFLNILNGRRKRAAKTTTTTTTTTTTPEYHHRRRPTADQSNMEWTTSSTDMGRFNATLANEMAKNGALNRTTMFGWVSRNFCIGDKVDETTLDLNSLSSAQTRG